MALRPIGFSIPSSSELKVIFSEDISTSLSDLNFQTRSLNPSVPDLTVRSIEIDNNTVYIKTSPQVSGNYYLLKLLDTAKQPFESVRGERLIDDAVSRELFFVGIEDVNPIRDNMFSSLPPIYDIENTNLKSVLTAQSKEFLKAQVKIGEVLSNNYISIDVRDERYTRSAGAFDRLKNENVFDIYRVSKTPSFQGLKFKQLFYDDSLMYSEFSSIPNYPISLQQKFIESEEISVNTEDNSFDGYLLTVKNKNVIKVISVLIVKPDDVEDCDGNIGTVYDLDKYKYSLKSNYYDPENGFSFQQLSSNQILLSDLANIDRPSVSDTIYVTYLYKDMGVNIDPSTVSFFRIENEEFESIPSNVSRFFLKNAPIVNENGDSIALSGIEFRSTENSTVVPAQFKREIQFNVSKLPSLPGEYSVNYETGEVFVFGESSDNPGTGQTNYIASYYWKKIFKEDLDYAFSNNDIVSIPNRNVAGNKGIIEFSYEQVFVKDIDYKISSHVEVMPEQVENRVSGYFSVRTKQSPITNVFKILNQTTGEIYTPVHFSDTDIYFSGRRSPEIKEVSDEQAEFEKISNEELSVIGQFINPIFEVSIVSNISNNAIEFYPPIPAELFSYNSDQYFCRVTDSSETIAVDDINIQFFGTPDGNNLISTFAIPSLISPPSVGDKVTIGLKTFVIYFDETNVLNKNTDALGNVTNSSLEFSNDIFELEKFFEPLQNNPGFSETENGKFTLALTIDKDDTFYKNLSRIRNIGEYAVDYKNGIAYLCVEKNQETEVGSASYFCSRHKTQSLNVQNIFSVSKKYQQSDSSDASSVVYSEYNNNVDKITLNDIDEGYNSFENETIYDPTTENDVFICQVLEDYTVLVKNKISGINAIINTDDLFGKNLNSQIQSFRYSDSGSIDLLEKTIDGGKNIYNEKVTYNENIIDLKRYAQRRVFLNGSNFEVTIEDPQIETFYSATLTRTGIELFNGSLDVDKITDISIVSITDLGGTAEVEIQTNNDTSGIDGLNDLFVDEDGNEFPIISYDMMASVLEISLPAVNTSEPLPVLGNSKIIVKASVVISPGEMLISIPDDAPIADGDMLTIAYLTSDIPEVGTSVFVDYRFGDIYFDYSYVYDQIAVWYEWGDNSIDWSVNNSINESEDYYVSYKYGALRDALKSNFGILTQVPFLRNFSLDTDRELYRTALESVMLTYPRGPTVSSYKDLVKSFTSISPIVNELSFGNWILGKSSLNTLQPQYTGNLVFKGAKFSEGLMVDESVKINIPTASNISLNEGTFETWIAPEWAGIWNDAELSFDFAHIGNEIYSYNKKKSLIDSGWKKIDLDEEAGRFDDVKSGFTFSNFESISADDISQGRLGFGLQLDHANVSCDFELRQDLSVSYFGNNFAGINDGTEVSLQSEYEFLTTGYSDGHKFYGFKFLLSKVFGFSYSVLSPEYISLPNYNPPYPTRSCICSREDTISKINGFDELSVTFSLSSNFDTSVISENIIDDSAECFVISDNGLDFYQVIAFIDDQDVQTISIPNYIQKIIVKRIPINNQALSASGFEQINNSVISGAIEMFCKKIDVCNNDITDSSSFWGASESHIVDWSKKTAISLKKDLLQNRIDFSIKNYSSTMFISDALDVASLSIGHASPEDIFGPLIAITNTDILVEARLDSCFAKVKNRFDTEDIWVGAKGMHPKSSRFMLDRFASSLDANGLHEKSVTDEGIFIGFDEFCTSPHSDQVGQWVVKARARRGVEVPDSVTILGDEYETNFIIKNINHSFEGTILTSGEFSSVTRGRKNSDQQCSDNTCSSFFRYTGNEKLEVIGWSSIEESDSDLINTSIGGRIGANGKWSKTGEFTTTSSSGIYRLGPSTFTEDCETAWQESNVLATQLTCYNGTYEAKVSLKIASIDTDIPTGSFAGFSGNYTGKYTGISPLWINNGDKDIAICLGMSNSDRIVIVYDKTSEQIIDDFAFDWNDSGFHEFKVISENDLFTTYIDDIIYSQVPLSSFSSISSESNIPFLKIALFDSTMVDSFVFHSEMDGNQIHIDLIEMQSQYNEDVNLVENTDIIINTDDSIIFKFNIDSEDIADAYEGYDAYDGVDGYGPTEIVSDEIMFSSDNLRYIIDAKSENNSGRFSIFKDGKGFLNFFICENKRDDSGQNSEYNISHNIKHFKPGELHHIAAGWRLNTIDEKDEMHLFVDGFEVPNIYKFGGFIPVSINEKFSDVSKESLWAFNTRDVEFCDTYTDGVTSASSNVFSSASFGFTSDMVGLAITFTDSNVLTEELNRAYYIHSVIDSEQVILADLKTMSPITFNASASNISFKLFPIAGRLSHINTDLKNDKFIIERTDNSLSTTEYSGIVYNFSDNTLSILSGGNTSAIKYWANADTRVIQFLMQNEDCLWESSISPTDINVNIQTFGLTTRRIRQDIQLTSSSYLLDPHPLSGRSIIFSKNIEPVDLQDVSIKRVLLPRTLMPINSPGLDFDGDLSDTFSMNFNSELGYYKVSSESGAVYNSNEGRKLSVIFDSDNVDFSKYNADETQVQDGGLDSETNTITVYGETTDGYNEETFFIRKNGAHYGQKYFKTITSVSANLKIVDEYFPEIGVLEIQESDSITVQNNSGIHAEVWSYKNGQFEVSKYGTNGESPFELHPGYWIIDYPAYLNIDLKDIGKNISIGSDIYGKNSVNAVMDELVICSEISTDTRPFEISSDRRSVTEGFNKTKEYCPASNILTLIHFNDPKTEQIRRLRNTKFLDENTNYVYTLTTQQIDDILPYINDEAMFVLKLSMLNISESIARQVFYEVHRSGGPINNDSIRRNNFDYSKSSGSVNDYFGDSAVFSDSKGLFISNNNSEFRAKEGSMEFWVSPEIDTSIDSQRRYYIDIYSAKTISVKSTTSTRIDLPNSASKIVSLKLISKKKQYEQFYNSNENILFDEIERSIVSGVLEGGSGHRKDFLNGSTLSPDGRTIYLSSALPGNNIDVVVNYVPRENSGDRFSIFKDENSYLTFVITANGVDNVINMPVNWRRNSWHKILVNYKTGTKNDVMKLFVGGEEGGVITFGENLVVGNGYVYGQYVYSPGQTRNNQFTIPVKDDFGVIAIGSDIFGDNSAKGRLDNVRFSRKMRSTPRDAVGNSYDPNWSSNQNTVRPLIRDDVTSMLIDFDNDGEIVEKYAVVKDPKAGVFDFEIKVIDEFEKVIGNSNGEVEDLIVDLVNRLKPAHTNAYVRFLKNNC